jgi:hypothetical protein
LKLTTIHRFLLQNKKKPVKTALSEIKIAFFFLRQERHLFVFLNLRPNYIRAFGAIKARFNRSNLLKQPVLALSAIPVPSHF